MSENEKSSKPSKNQILNWRDFALISLGNGRRAIIDVEDIPRIRNYKWRAVKASRLWYVKTTVGPAGKRTDLSLHRMIARTPRDQVCHHKNRNSMDNRKENLDNMDPTCHSDLHRMNNLIVKFSSPGIFFC